MSRSHATLGHEEGAFRTRPEGATISLRLPVALLATFIRVLIEAQLAAGMGKPMGGAAWVIGNMQP